MASTKSGCGGVKSCARDFTPPWPTCGVWGGKAGASSVPEPRSSDWPGESEAGVLLEALLRQGRSGKYLGSLTNPDTGCPIETDGVRLSALDFEKKRLHEIVEDSKAGKTKYSALWQADRSKIQRMAPAEYMGRYMPEWFDYAIADEVHQLAGDTAQGNALGVLNRTARRFPGSRALCCPAMPTISTTPCSGSTPSAWRRTASIGARPARTLHPAFRRDRDHRAHQDRGQRLLQEEQD